MTTSEKEVLKRLYHIFLVALLLSFNVSKLFGQDDAPQIKFDAKITSVEENGAKLDVVKVIVTVGEDTLKQEITQNGRMFFQLDTGKVYKIEFSKSGYVSKHLIVSTVDAPNDVKKKSTLKVEVSLFKFKQGLKVDFLATKPMGVAKYDHSTSKLEWNKNYTRSIIEMIITATLENYSEENENE